MTSGGSRVKIEFHASMRDVFQEKGREIGLGDVSNIQGILDILCNTYQRRQRVFNQSGQLRPDVNVLKNGRNVRFLDGVETEVEEGDVISVFPLVHGG